MDFHANYQKAVNTAIEVLEDYEIQQAPINLQIFFDALNMELRLMTYGDVMALQGITRNKAIEIFESDLGSCLYNSKTEQYVILYNEEHVDEFCRFTIAHELGHYFLGHHRLARVSALYRSSMPDNEYKQYENEANAFARNLLSPAPLAYYLQIVSLPKSTAYYIERIFGITATAAEVRLQCLKLDMPYYDEHMHSVALAIEMKCRPSCRDCGAMVPLEALYCICCGSGRIMWSTEYNSLPPEIHYDKNGTFPICPRCGNNDIAESAEFCMICGLPLKNLCNGGKNTSTEQPHFNNSNAKFCAKCGSITRYNTIGFHPSMKGVTEMNYTDGVEYDLNSYKIKICPRCHNEEFSNNALFCRICGIDLYNKCIGEIDSDSNGFSQAFDQHPNPSNARYCEICGKETVFLKKGILKPYNEYLAEKHEEDMASEWNAPQNDDFEPWGTFDSDAPFN